MPTINKLPVKKKIDKTSSQSTKYYNSKAWKHLRHAYINAHPLCEECIIHGRSTPAVHVHHKIEFLRGDTEDDRWRLLLDLNNLQSLCLKCHHKAHKHRR